MVKICYDVARGTVSEEERTGLSGFMSWNRLAQLLVASGEVQQNNEVLTCITATERGLNLTFERRAPAEPYRCGTCGTNDPKRFQRCYHPGCPDGRDR